MSGRLGGFDLAATTWTEAYTVGATDIATVTLVITNRNSSDVRVRVAVKADNVGSPTAVDYIEYDSIVGDIPLRVEGVVLEGGNSLFVYSDTANVTAMVYGFVEAV